MWQTLQAWLTLPTFGDEALNRNLRVLNWIILSGIPVSAILAIILLIFSDLRVGPLIGLAMTLVLVGLSHLLRRGKLALVGHILIWSSLLSGAITAVTSGGIRDTSLTIMYLQITLAAVFLSRRATMIFTTAVITFFGILYWAEVSGNLRTFYERPPTIDALAIDILTAILTAVIVRLVVEQMSKHANQIQAQTAVLQQKNDELAQLNNQLVEQTQQRLRAEAVLHQKQKLESIGLLAGGVAHDFNNLLTGILGQISLVQRKLPPNHKANPNASKAIASAERARDLTQQLLAYAGKSNFMIEPLDLNQLIRENDGLLETSVQRQAQLVLDLAPQLPLVEMDKGQIQQIVMNLAINAAEAISAEATQAGTGIVTIRTTQKRPIFTDNENSRTFSFIEQNSNTPYLCLEVSDNGAGMDITTVEQIFDPFYSTKAKGHGLGLSAVIGIVRAQKGSLTVISQQGIGTQFHLFLPAAETAVLPPPKQPTDVTHHPQSGLILVIDDEPSVLEVVAEAFDLIGLQTLAASDGQRGIDLFRQHCQTIDLVLLDLQMPQMNGEETLKHLRQIKPDVVVLLSSGYSEVEMEKRPFFSQIAGFLQKPYDLNTLIQTVLTKLEQPALDEA